MAVRGLLNRQFLSGLMILFLAVVFAVGGSLATSATPAVASIVEGISTETALQPQVVSSNAHGSFVSQVPHRILDTRNGPDGCLSAAIKVPVAGVTGVPTTATAVVLNVTVVLPSASGYLTVWPFDPEYWNLLIPDPATRPLASNLNFLANEVIPNMVTVGLGFDGAIAVYANAGCPHVVIDVAGWFSSNPPSNGGFQGVTPSRALDTRIPVQGPCVSSTPRTLTIAGTNGVPADATAVALNVTVVSPSNSGYLTVYPAGVSRPLASNLNYVAGQVVPNMVLTKLGGSGAIEIFSSSGCPHVVVDVAGWFAGGTTTDGGFAGLTPARAIDTRDGIGCVSTSGRTVRIAGSFGVPADASAVALNVTVVSPSNSGFATVYPTGASRPLASNLNYVAGQVVPNMVVSKLGSDGSITLFTNSGCPNMVVDVTGWFASPPRLTGVNHLSVGGTSICGVGPSLGSYMDTTCWGTWRARPNFGAQKFTTASEGISFTGYDAYQAIVGGDSWHCGVGSSAVTIECFGDNPVGGMTAPNYWISMSGKARNLCAVNSTRIVKCEGTGTSGQLGNGSWTDSASPVTVSGISTAAGVAVGGNHACARLVDKTVKCWGSNLTGALGNNSTISSPVPVTVSGLTDSEALAAGPGWTCTIVTSGAVKCWGEALALGNSASQNSLVPVTVPNVSDARQITGGNGFVCALLATGRIKCWGSNYWYQLGNGSTAPSANAGEVFGITNATEVAAGSNSACAVLGTGEVVCWGDRDQVGGLGNGDLNPGISNVPLYVIHG